MAWSAMTNRTPVRDSRAPTVSCSPYSLTNVSFSAVKETWTSIGIDANKARCFRPNSRNRTKDPEGKDPCPKEGPEGQRPKNHKSPMALPPLSARCLLSVKVDAMHWA